MMLYPAAWALIATAIYFNLLPLFTSKGLSEAQAAATYTVLALAAVITQFVAGILADRLPLNWLLSLASAALIMAILSLALIAASWT